MKKYILIVWEIIPEAIHLYLIPKEAISDHQLKLINFANLKIINQCEDSEVDRLNELSDLLDNEWKDYKIDDEILGLGNDQHIEQVITSGFML